MFFVKFMLFATLGICSFFDLRYHKISGMLVAVTAILLVAVMGWLGVLTLKRLLGAMLVCGMFLCISIITGEKLGRGDGLLFGMVGLAVGLQRNLMMIMMCFCMAFILAVCLYLSRKADRNTEIPLAPIMFISTALTLWRQPLP
ncbi:MAG: prepilin peptidase [Lachnospiraceae bacterium]|nr:prepilin peptidase [Lachnospiraceae bacterium]